MVMWLRQFINQHKKHLPDQYETETKLFQMMVKWMMIMPIKKMNLCQLKIHQYHDTKDDQKPNATNQQQKKSHVQSIPAAHVVSWGTIVQAVKITRYNALYSFSITRYNN